MGSFRDVMAVDWHTGVLEQNIAFTLRDLEDGGTALKRNIGDCLPCQTGRSQRY